VPGREAINVALASGLGHRLAFVLCQPMSLSRENARGIARLSERSHVLRGGGEVSGSSSFDQRQRPRDGAECDGPERQAAYRGLLAAFPCPEWSASLGV
jgi:hypothetical protein